MIRTVSIPTASRPGYYDPDFHKKIVLADGGVYDNLGLERAWKHHKTILVSDGGGLLEAEADPAEDWLGMTNRVLSVIYNQVRALPKRAVIEFFSSQVRHGSCWGIGPIFGVTYYRLPWCARSTSPLSWLF